MTADEYESKIIIPEVKVSILLTMVFGTKFKLFSWSPVPIVKIRVNEKND